MIGVWNDRAAQTRRPGRLTAVATGALLMYLFDPAMGRSRRAQIRDRLAGSVRSGERRAERAGRAIAAQGYGIAQKVAHTGSTEEIPPNDAALTAKIESEVLSRWNYPKGQVKVNSEGGLVYLRGQLDDQDSIDSLEQEVRKVTGVVDVRNLLHLPGEDPPNKEDALRTT